MLSGSTRCSPMPLEHEDPTLMVVPATPAESKFAAVVARNVHDTVTESPGASDGNANESGLMSTRLLSLARLSTLFSEVPAPRFAQLTVSAKSLPTDTESG